MEKHTKGLLIGASGILVLSPDAILIRLISFDTYTLIALRGFFMAIGTGVLIVCFPNLRRGFRWSPILLYALIFSVGVICFPLSIKNTHIATTLVTLSTAPIFAAIGAHIFIGEKTALSTWVTGLIVFMGIAFIFSDSFGHTQTMGILFGLVTAIMLAVNSIVIRKQQNMALFPGILLSSLFITFIFLPFVDFTSIDTKSQDMALIFIDGSFIMAFSFLLITVSSRLLPPAEISLLFLLEIIFGSLWAWLIIDEVPPSKTLLACAIIFLALSIYGYWSLKIAPKKFRQDY